MADLVIRGMRIPPQCVLYDEYRVYYKCPFADEGKWGVLVCTCPNQKRGARIVNEYTETRHPDCPLVPLPEGHGDLIDRDALKKRTPMVIDYSSGGFGTDGSIRPVRGYGDWQIDQSPTIVPAEGGTDECSEN